MRRIGLYGGTFDPPHLGHTEMLLQAKKQLDLDLVIVLPCGDPVHKSGVTNKQQRYEMCKTAFSGADGIFVSDYEVEKPEKSYSLYTLRHFAEIFADSELYFIIGSDSLEDFSKWYKPEEISQLCTLTIAPRANHRFNKAKDFAEKTGLKYLGIDDFYAEVNGDECIHENPFEVWINFFLAIRESEMMKENIVVDTNALTFCHRTQFIEWFPEFDHHLIYIKASKELYILNNNNRKRVIPLDRIEEMEKKFIPPIEPSLEDPRWLSITKIENYANNFKC